MDNHSHNSHSLPKTILHLWNRWKSASVDIMHIEAQKAFLKTIQSVRLILMALVAAWCFFGMMMFAVGMIHAAVYIAFPADQKLMSVLLLLSIDAVVLAVLGFYLFSEKKWLEYAHSYRMFHWENGENAGAEQTERGQA